MHLYIFQGTKFLERFALPFLLLILALTVTLWTDSRHLASYYAINIEQSRIFLSKLMDLQNKKNVKIFRAKFFKFRRS